MTKPDPTPSADRPAAIASGRGRRPEPLGAYRRAVRIEAGEGWASAEMEDDVHHFRARLVHDGARILAAQGRAVRTPWSACMGAVDQLKTLEGLGLAEALALPADDRMQHCTHLFDLAVLAAAHAGEPGFRRIYRIEVHHRPDGRACAALSRDGRPALAWEVHDGTIEGGAFDGVSLNGLSRRLAGLDPEAREAALVLRRTSHTSYARLFDLDAFPRAVDITTDRPPVCYAQQAHRRPQALRNVGTTRDFWGEGAWPLTDEDRITNWGDDHAEGPEPAG